MCFLINELTPDPLIAIENIVCFKIVKKDLTSYYNSFQYEIGETYKMEENLKIEKPVIDFDFKFSNSLVINEGFHSLLAYECIDIPLILSNDMKTATTLKCVIPKGSTYYINIDLGEYVSNKIKIIKIYKSLSFYTNNLKVLFHK